MPLKFKIVDYGSSNLRSVYNAINRLDVDCSFAMTPADLQKADAIILPGVGAFAHAMKNLDSSGLRDALENEIMNKGKPFLGICLGMQILANHSEEGAGSRGLGWIDGEVKQLDHTKSEHVPNIGWRFITSERESVLFNQLTLEQRCFYFVHSYALECDEKLVDGRCRGNEKIVAAIHHQNLFGTQFHPEKSSRAGHQLLTNFHDYVLVAS